VGTSPSDCLLWQRKKREKGKLGSSYSEEVGRGVGRREAGMWNKGKRALNYLAGKGLLQGETRVGSLRAVKSSKRTRKGGKKDDLILSILQGRREQACLLEKTRGISKGRRGGQKRKEIETSAVEQGETISRRAGTAPNPRGQKVTNCTEWEKGCFL